MRDRIKCLKCEKFFYRNNKSVVCPTCIQKDSKEYYTKKITDLEAKLAEKDKKLTKLKSENHALMSDNAYQEADIFELKQQIAEKEKDKIDYAVEKLEKVKEMVEEKGEISSPFGTLKIFASDVDTIIDQLITEIKEGK